MIILRGPTSISRIPDNEIRCLVEQRFAEICAGEVYDYDIHGYMIVLEPGDSVVALEKESSCPILRDLFDEYHFGDPDFVPAFETLEDHCCCYEMVFIMTDETGIGIFIPKMKGVDTELLAMCKSYAVPASIQK